jgi:hypothetical protein
MFGETDMSATTDTDADLAAIRSDLSNLKGDVASLNEHFKDQTEEWRSRRLQ